MWDGQAGGVRLPFGYLAPSDVVRGLVSVASSLWVGAGGGVGVQRGSPSSLNADLMDVASDSLEEVRETGAWLTG